MELTADEKVKAYLEGLPGVFSTGRDRQVCWKVGF